MDDHSIVRNGLRLVEEVAPDIRIVGATAIVEEGWTQLQLLFPELVLLDLRLPDGDGLEICRRAKARYPNILSPKTVRNALDRVFAKLGVHTRTRAAMLYADYGKSGSLDSTG